MSEGTGDNRLALAPQLAQAGVGAVLAMQGNVALESIAAGMPVLFSELRRHGCIDLAVAVMRNLLERIWIIAASVGNRLRAQNKPLRGSKSISVR